MLVRSLHVEKGFSGPVELRGAETCKSDMDPNSLLEIGEQRRLCKWATPLVREELRPKNIRLV